MPPQLERNYETLIKTVRSLEGELADYNLAMDKSRTSTVRAWHHSVVLPVKIAFLRRPTHVHTIPWFPICGHVVALLSPSFFMSFDSAIAGSDFPVTIVVFFGVITPSL